MSKDKIRNIVVAIVVIIGLASFGGYKLYAHIHQQHEWDQVINSNNTPTTLQLDGLLSVTLPCQPAGNNKPSAILDDNTVVAYQTTCVMEVPTHMSGGYYAPYTSGDTYTVTGNRYLTSGAASINQDLSNCSPTIDPITFKTEVVNGATFNECVTQANDGIWSVWAIAAQPNANNDAIVQVTPPGGVTKSNNATAWGALESVVETLQFK